MLSHQNTEQALSHSDYWDEQYATATGDKPTHEWHRSFNQLESFFQSYLFRNRSKDTRILHLGSGDSNVPYDLLERGYRNQLCIDFSTVVANLMKSRHADKPQVAWQVGDVRNMSEIARNSVDVVFDKCTLDCMSYGSPWSPPKEVLENSRMYLGEVWRVLKDDGVFLYVTYRQPHFVKPILNSHDEWDLDMEVLGGGGGTFHYFGFILKKHSTGSG
ncbi:uncharacterized protein J4E79_002089 [Alternaria viburni]|uniref:uncharacterized protein n=1 Tax=Alternaria viburni TaxID=566460 RepID=UPI0020C40E9F|nr:uncharacterized protein J4E79_002089 [Alternaria viburni]KAI4667403.1 hypothetical protein J4E79_002089 [Alternaria viburni]